MKYILLLITILVSINTIVKASSWTDPSWKKMLDDSDVIALVKYTKGGDFQAKAKIQSIYKGNLNIGDEIWISGFSNTYGPFDKMKKGDRYLVFINLNEPSESNMEYWNKEVKYYPKLKKFVKALKEKKAYYVWTPTSGDYKITNDFIQYDLTTSSAYKGLELYALNDFDSFLNAYLKKENIEKYKEEIVLKIKSNTEDEDISQNLMKLYLLNYMKFFDAFHKISKVEDIASKYALAKLLGNIKNEDSYNILISLIDDESSFVQGEAIRQLKTQSPDFVGPIFIKKLKSSSEINYGPSSLMDPVENRYDGGKTEIIRALGELKYKPAIPDLLPLLETNDVNQFMLVIDALKKIGTKEYIPYINKHLENQTKSLISRLYRMIAKDSLVECLPSLKNYISNCDRNGNSGIISKYGLGKFKSIETIDFLLTDFENFLNNKEKVKSKNQLYWIESFIDIFTHLGVKESRPLIIKSIYDWTGINQDFAIHPKLFDIKKNAEDSLLNEAKTKLSQFECELNYCIAYIKNTAKVINGKKPIIEYLAEIAIPNDIETEKNKAIIVNELKLKLEKVYIKNGYNSYYIEKQARFSERFIESPIVDYLDFAKSLPNIKDVELLQAMIDHRYIADEFYIKKIQETISEIELKIKDQNKF